MFRRSEGLFGMLKDCLTSQVVGGFRVLTVFVTARNWFGPHPDPKGKGIALAPCF
jgi:hypothetical protein